MSFNSIEFLIFFPAVVILYFSLPHRFRWILLLIASYYFYMCWNAKYIILIGVSTLTAYATGRFMGRAMVKKKKRRYLLLSLMVNLGLLFLFKYFDFFNASIQSFLEQFNIFMNVPFFNKLLPVGISFYTFQTLSYSIDVYRGTTKPEKHLGIFALYVSFFPQLVAGPIERSRRLLPQFYQKNVFDYDRVTSGLRLMLWGFFKKIVIADRLALYVNAVYNNPSSYEGLPLLIATYFFAFQIYCDFSGYSDIAIGGARVLGYDLMKNFRQPYLAASLSDFWNRWHISLSTWLRDYLFLPLAYWGARKEKISRLLHLKPEVWGYAVGIFITMFLGGLWHGAAWTFVIWGTLHGLFLVFSHLTRKIRIRLNQKIGLTKWHRLHQWMKRFFTFHLICLTWIFFRSNSLADARIILVRIFTGIIHLNPGLDSMAFNGTEFGIAVGAIFIVIFIQLFREKIEIGSFLLKQPVWCRWLIYWAVCMIVLVLGEFGSQEFIYFQF